MKILVMVNFVKKLLLEKVVLSFVSIFKLIKILIKSSINNSAHKSVPQYPHRSFFTSEPCLEKGAVAVTTLFVIPLLLVFSILLIDISRWNNLRTELQLEADLLSLKFADADLQSPLVQALLTKETNRLKANNLELSVQLTEAGANFDNGENVVTLTANLESSFLKVLAFFMNEVEGFRVEAKSSAVLAPAEYILIIDNQNFLEGTPLKTDGDSAYESQQAISQISACFKLSALSSQSIYQACLNSTWQRIKEIILRQVEVFLINKANRLSLNFIAGAEGFKSKRSINQNSQSSTPGGYLTESVLATSSTGDRLFLEAKDCAVVITSSLKRETIENCSVEIKEGTSQVPETIENALLFQPLSTCYQEGCLNNSKTLPNYLFALQSVLFDLLENDSQKDIAEAIRGNLSVIPQREIIFFAQEVSLFWESEFYSSEEIAVFWSNLEELLKKKRIHLTIVSLKFLSQRSDENSQYKKLFQINGDNPLVNVLEFSSLEEFENSISVLNKIGRRVVQKL